MSFKHCGPPLARQCLGSMPSSSFRPALAAFRFVARPTVQPFFTSTRSLHLPLSQMTARPPSFPPPLGRRLFSSYATLQFVKSRPRSIRQTYFPRGSSGNSGPSPRSPWNGFIRWLNRLPHMTVIYGIIGVNVGVFLLWQYGIQSYQRFRDPSLYRWMSENFVLNEANVLSGRIHTLLTACFSHSSGSHIFINCLGLYFVAPAVASLIGTASFLGLYLGGGILASLTSLAWHRAVGDKRWKGSEGASGAIYASLAFYGALFPNSTFLLFFVVPMPAWAMIGGIFAYDLYSAVFQPMSGTDSAGHMGGIAAGVAAALWLKRRGRSSMRWR